MGCPVSLCLSQDPPPSPSTSWSNSRGDGCRVGQEHHHQPMVLWVLRTQARALPGTGRRCSLATAWQLGRCCWSGTVTARPRLLQDLWAVPACVFYISLGLHDKCSHAGTAGGSLVGSAASRATFWMCGRRSPPERGRMSTDMEEVARSHCWVLQRSDMAGRGYPGPAHPASAPPLAPLFPVSDASLTPLTYCRAQEAV